MQRSLAGLLAGVCVGALGVGVLVASSQAAVGTEFSMKARKANSTSPKPGPWKFKDAFGDSAGTFKVKPGKRGKPSTVTKVRFEILAQDNGKACPAPGQTVVVKGRFKLRKAIKYSQGSVFGSPWMLAAKDAPPSNDYPNLVYMRPVETTAKIGPDTRYTQLAMLFKKDGRKKPNAVRLGMRVAPPGSNDLNDGWCIFDGTGKPGKG